MARFEFDTKEASVSIESNSRKVVTLAREFRPTKVWLKDNGYAVKITASGISFASKEFVSIDTATWRLIYDIAENLPSEGTAPTGGDLEA